MQAIIINQFGGAGQLRVGEIERPVPAENQVLIKVKAIGINPVDTKVRAGTNRIAKSLSLPAVIGWDVSGEIAACGTQVTSFKNGDPVFGCIGFPGAGGAYAEYAVADVQAIAMKPEKVSFEEAAALPIAGLTAYQAIHDHLDIQPKQKLLLQAAAGGVGHLAVQFAKEKRAHVTATASEKNRAFLENIGVDQFVNYKKEKFEDYIQEADAALDAMGGEILYRSIGCTRRGGTVVCLPSSTKDDPRAIALAKEKEIKLIWPTMRVDQNQLKTMADQLASGALQVHIDKVFPMIEMAKAHEAIEGHSTRGKIVVLGSTNH